MPAWSGIAACLIGAVCGVIALIFCFARPKPLKWFTNPIFLLAVMGILYGYALLWGNVGVIFSNAGFTG